MSQFKGFVVKPWPLRESGTSDNVVASENREYNFKIDKFRFPYVCQASTSPYNMPFISPPVFLLWIFNAGPPVGPMPIIDQITHLWRH